MAGATIAVKGTRATFVAGQQVAFSFEVAEGSKILVIGYLGYQTTEVPVANFTMIALEFAKNDIQELRYSAIKLRIRKAS